MTPKKNLGPVTKAVFPLAAGATGIPLTSKERVTLIHKGNALFQLGQVDLAERVFRTAKYQDGLVRTGEYWEKKGQYLRAADLFRHAKYLRGEYRCYLKLGLIKEVADVNDDGARMAMDEQVNKSLAAAVRTMMARV